MNSNLDFRNSDWDDTPIEGSVGDCLPSQKALGFSAAVITFVVAILVCI